MAHTNGIQRDSEFNLTVSAINLAISACVLTMSNALSIPIFLVGAGCAIHWADWLAKDAKLIRFHDGFGLEHLLAAYGGMGSLNDVVLQLISAGAGVLVPRDDNERFDELRRQIYDVATRLNKWVNVGD